MLTLTAISAGAVEYLLRGSDCAAHAHAPSGAQQGADTAAGGESGRAAGRPSDAVSYLLAGAATEPAGVWFGEGLSMLGIQSGSAASEAQVRAVFGRLEHPTQRDAEGRLVSLGSRPRSFRSRAEREAQALAAEPDATEERRAKIRNRVYADTRKAVAYYDLMFAPVKSVSVYWTGLLLAGRDAEAANVVAAHRAGVTAAMVYVEREAGHVRSGYHGTTLSGQSVGVYEQARGLAWARWDHSTSRAQQPHLHSHVTVVNRAETVSDGKLRALASRGFRPIKQAADAIYTQTSQRMLSEVNGVVFATRGDGKAAEILGFSPQLLAKASARRLAVERRRDQLVAQFEQDHARAASPLDRKRMHRAAWRETRQAKNHAIAPRQQLANWAAPVRGEVDQAVTAAAGHAARIARVGHPDQQGYAGRSREQVLRAAVRAVQDQYPSWDIGNLVAAIVEQQRRTPTVTGAGPELAAEVLRQPARYGVVLLSKRDVGRVPQSLRRADGFNRYRLKNDARYATATQLRTESAIVARAVSGGAPALAGPPLELARVELQAMGLTAEQRAAVARILSSGRRGDVLIGPAGAGKSRTIGALNRVWTTHVGGRVFGVATSQIATKVLTDDGLTALNSTQFRNRFLPDPQGRVRDRLRPDDLVVVDEAGMSGTDELDAISTLVEAAGAKLVYAGDHGQLGAVGAGGLLELLVGDADPIELTEIHRFAHAWEREASMRLRAGDPDVLAVYAAHGRIRGGTEQEMIADAVRGYLADVLGGHRSLLIVRDNATAAELSARIRAELVAAGRVYATVLGETSDRHPIGRGDWIQARRNDPDLRVEGPGMVTNREVYQVVGRNRLSGSLTVRDRNGVLAHLPDGYVREHTTLAYAVNEYAAQGVTVDSGHHLVSPGADLAGLYTSATRGRHTNTLYVVCRHDPDHHDPQRIDRPPTAALADVLTRPVDCGRAAELERRAGAEDGRSLAWVGGQWDLLTAEYSRDRATDTLLALLGPDTVQRVVAEPGYRRLLSAVRGMELAGHDPHQVLVEAVRQATLHDAHSVSDVLRYRVRRLEAAGRAPERTVRAGDWTTFTTRWAGPVGDYRQVLAAAATARQTELGARAAETPPAWAVAAPTLGEPPDQPRERAEWVRRAGIVAAYRDLHAIPDRQLSIGAAPSREREFHYALWRQAIAALGHPADALDYAMASDGELREMRAAWRREQAWAPVFVAEDLHTARELAEDYRRDAVMWRAGVDRRPPGTAHRELAERDLAAAEQLAAVYAARVVALEQVQTVRAAWYERTREVRERASFAGDELERRGLDRDTAAPVGQQQALFRTAEPNAATNATVDAAAASGSLGQSNASQADTPADGYAEVFAEANRAAERDRHQPALFDLPPNPADVAGAQPLHGAPRVAAIATTGAAGPSNTANEPAGPPVTSSPADAVDADGEQADTLGRAQRQAQIIAALRADIDAAARRRHHPAAHEHHDQPDAARRRDAEEVNAVELGAADPDPAATAQRTSYEGLSHGPTPTAIAAPAAPPDPAARCRARR